MPHGPALLGLLFIVLGVVFWLRGRRGEPTPEPQEDARAAPPEPPPAPTPEPRADSRYPWRRPPDDPPKPQSREDAWREWVEQANRVPKPPDTAPERPSQERLELARWAEKIRDDGYVRWVFEPPPVGTWVETVRAARPDESTVLEVDGWWPADADNLYWRPTPKPTPGKIIQLDPRPDDEDSAG